MQTEMEYVYRVYKEKSFTRAAEALFISQPALSMAIKKVEDSLGMPIFDRSVRPLGLTPAGEAYIEYIENSNFLESEMHQHMQDIRELNTGSIRIGGSHYINAYILPPVLAGFTRQYPRIKIELLESSSAILSKMLGEREVDITFNCNPKFMLDFERYPAFGDNILLAVPNTYEVNLPILDKRLSAVDILQKKHLSPDCPTVPLKVFSNEPFILLNRGNNLHDRAKQLFEEAGFHPQIKMELSQLVTAYRLANASLGVTFVSDRLVNTAQDNLCYYKLDTDLTERLFYMLLPNRKYTSMAVRAFVRYCSEALQ